MKPGEIYKLEENDIEEFNDIKYIKFVNFKKEKDCFKIDLTTLGNKNEKGQLYINGEIIFDLISSGKIYPTTDTDKAKIVLMVKGF